MDELIKEEISGKISVIIPAYNCERYLERCVDSVLRANPFEIILVDDCSIDRTSDLCDYLANKACSVRVIYNEVNLGVVGSRNKGISKAKGEYIAFVDSDDWIDAEFLMRAADELNERLFVDIVVGRMIEDDDRDYSLYIGNITNEVLLNHDEAIAGLIEWKYYRWELCGKVFRSKLFDDWKADDSIKLCEDLDSTWELFMRANKTICLPIDYYHYFYNEDSASHSVNILQGNSVKVLEKVIEKGKSELSKNVLMKVKENYRHCLISLIREAIFQDYGEQYVCSLQEKLRDLYYEMNIEQTPAVRKLSTNYKTAKIFLEEIEKEMIDLLNRVNEFDKNIYFYGTGAMSDYFSRIAINNDFYNFAYVVSNGQVKRNSFYKKNVYYIDQVGKDSVVLLTLNSNIRDDLYETLNNSGYCSVFKVDDRGVFSEKNRKCVYGGLYA